MSFQTSALVLSWVAILLLALVVSGLVRQVHALSTGLRPAHRVGPVPGAPAPDLPRLVPESDSAVLLLFADPQCQTCGDVLDEAARYPIPVHAIYRAEAPAAAPVPVHEHESGLFAAYQVPATPYAVLVDRHGRVDRAGPVGSRTALRDLLGPFAAPAGDASASPTPGGRS